MHHESVNFSSSRGLQLFSSSADAPRLLEKQQAESATEKISSLKNGGKFCNTTESPLLNLIYVVSINFNSLKGSIKLDLMVEILFVKKCLQFLSVSLAAHIVLTQDT